MENGKDKRLDELLASYGADRARWPAAERDSAGLARPEAEGEARRIDRLLSLATTPQLPEGAMARLMQRIEAKRPSAQVILMAPRPARRSFIRAAAALPLAASLALGVYLGARGQLDFMLPSAITGGIALNDEIPDELGGVGEADAYAYSEENLT